MSYLFDPITGTFVYQSRFPEVPNFRLPEPPQDETMMYEQPLVPQRPVAVSPVSPRMWQTPRREFGMTEADLLPPIPPQDAPPPQPEPPPPPQVNPMVAAFNRNRPPLFGVFGSRAPAAEPAAVLTSATVDPEATAQAQPDPAAAAPTQPAQPPATPPATPPAAPASNPVTAALGGPAQPPPDPFADHFQTMTRFEGTGVNPASGASGFGQVLPSTYADWVTRFGARFPWMPRTLEEYRNAPLEVQQRVYREIVYPNEYQPALQNAGLEFTPLNAAVVNFLGPTGGVRFLQGANQNPSAPATSLASPAAVDANRNVFFDRDGRERNAGEVLQFIAQGGGRGGGALTAAGGGTADQRTNAAAANPETPQPTNPYRERLLQLLTSIEGERNSRPDTGELLLRMGAGILSGRDLMDGMGRGGAAVAELMQQTRQDNARRDQTLVGGFQGLVTDRRLAQQQRDTFNAPRNVRIIPRDGSPAFDVIGRIINGQTMVRHPTTGQEVAVNEAYPNASATFAGMNDRPLFEQQAGGIPGAVRVTRIGGEDIPVFEFNRESDGKAFGFGLNAITAHQRLMQLEQSGNFNPTSVTAAIAQYLSDRGPIDIRRVGSLFTSPQDQAYATAVLQYVNAIARRESGAQINEGEWARYSAMFAARPGESPQAVVERAQSRMNNIVPLIGQAGPAAMYLGQVANGERRLPRAYSDPGVVDQSFNLNQPRPQAQPQGGGNNEPRIIEQLNASTINALRDDERVRVRINGQLQEVTGAQLKAELARRQGQQR